jgi:hypothetical protein
MPRGINPSTIMSCRVEGAPAIALASCYCGDLAEGECMLKPLRAFGTPLIDAFQPIPFPVLQSIIAFARSRVSAIERPLK